MHSTLLQNVVWVSGPLLQSAVAAMMIYRRVVRQFPVFWGYSVFHVLLFAVLYSASRISYRAYFDLYWGKEVVEMFFLLLVIQELFSHVFGLYEGIQHVGRILFRSAALVMIMVSIILARSGSTTSSLVERLVSLERSVHVFELGVLFVLFLACRIMGVVWQRFAFGIAVGMGLMLSGEAIVAALRAMLGAAGNPLYIILEPVCCGLATVVWAYYASLADPAPQSSWSVPPATQLAEWNHALEHFRSRS